MAHRSDESLNDDASYASYDDDSYASYASFDASSSSSENEPQDEYGVNGYMNVNLGELYNNRYKIVKKLGWGVFSTVWAAKDEKRDRWVAIKIFKCDPEFDDVVKTEVEIIKQLMNAAPENANHTINLYDIFKHQSNYGRHVCLVYELLGCHLLKISRIFKHRNKTVPLRLLRKVIRQCMEAFSYIHSKNIIHTDLKPENILIVPDERYIELMLMDNNEETKKLLEEHIYAMFEAGNVQIKIADWGNACWTNKHFSDQIQTFQYQAPEVIIGYRYNTKADIWSLACVFYELATNEYLFDARYDSDDDSYSSDDEEYRNTHLLLDMKHVIGDCPRSFALKGNDSRCYFNHSGKLRAKDIDKSDIGVLEALQNDLDAYTDSRHPEDEVKDFAEFLQYLLVYVPDKRPSAEASLKHPYLA
uniref:non-specific serine/threonine protein kinase n=1 Tax=viral metagenome TaxID=1070528 RepID=A0A6C0CKJ0_9ZZZZ